MQFNVLWAKLMKVDNSLVQIELYYFFLLPVAFQSLNKMWKSPSIEKLSLNKDILPVVNENCSKIWSRKGSLCNNFNLTVEPQISRKLSHHEPLISLSPESFKNEM